MGSTHSRTVEMDTDEMRKLSDERLEGLALAARYLTHRDWPHINSSAAIVLIDARCIQWLRKFKCQPPFGQGGG